MKCQFFYFHAFIYVRFEWYLSSSSVVANLIYTMSTFCQPMRLSFIYYFITQTQMIQEVFFHEKTFHRILSTKNNFNDDSLYMCICASYTLDDYRQKLSKVFFHNEREW